MFRREGEYWTIAFDGTVIRLRDTKGLRYLAVLLRRPGEPMHVTALCRLVADPAEDVHGEGRKARHEDGRTVPPVSARADQSAPTRRKTERARVNVTKALKATLDRIAAAHPPLGAHFGVTIRRGYSCVYAPDPRYPTKWEE